MCGRSAATHSTSRPPPRPSRSRSAASGAGSARGTGPMPCGTTVNGGRVEPERRADLVAGGRGHGDQRVGVARRAAHHLAHAPRGHAPEGRHAHEGHVVERHHRGEPGRADRAGAGEAVKELRTGSRRACTCTSSCSANWRLQPPVLLRRQRPQRGELAEAVGGERSCARAGREHRDAQAAGTRPRARARARAGRSPGPPESPGARNIAFRATLLTGALTRAKPRDALGWPPVHVGVNLLFLAPGEMGGLEVYSRELVRALAQRDDVRLTLFVNRLARAGVGGARADRRGAPIDPRRRAQWVAGDQLHAVRLARRAGVELVHSLASTGPGHGRLRARRRPFTTCTTGCSPRPTSGCARSACGCSSRSPCAGLDRVIVPSAATRDDLLRYTGARDERVDVVPEGIGQAPGEGGDARRRQGAARAGERPLVLSVSAKRPHKNLARLIRRARAHSGRAPAAAGPARLSHAARGGAAGARGVARAWRTTCASLGWLPRRGARRPLRRGRPASCSRRSTRASACRCSRRWRAACPWPRRDARAWPRWPATPRSCSTPRTSAPSPPPSSGCWPTTSCASACARRDASARPAFTWERTAELTVASYRRALAAR